MLQFSVASKRQCSALALPNATHVNASRRAILWTALIPSMQLVSAPISPPANAKDLGDFMTSIFPSPPQPVKFPRKPLNQAFAVLLMRSAYEAVDKLDFIPMDEFQVKFWNLRASQQESYNLQYSPLKPKVGDLTDPLYFDFISFSQFLTISQEIPKGLNVFKEFCEECPDQIKLVRRDQALSDNSKLPAAFMTTMGDLIYDGLQNGFRGTDFGAPAPLSRDAPITDVAQNIQRILDIMVANGFALKAEVMDVTSTEEASSPSSGIIRIKLQGGVNLWGLAALNFQRALVVDAYDSIVIDAYLRASGLTGEYEMSTTDTGAEVQWTIA